MHFALAPFEHVNTDGKRHLKVFHLSWRPAPAPRVHHDLTTRPEAEHEHPRLDTSWADTCSAVPSTTLAHQILCCLLLCSLHLRCTCFAHCCHDPFIVRRASNFSTSMFTINIDNCLVLLLFLLLFLVSPSLQPRRHIHHRLTSGLPCSISGLQPFTRSIIDFVSLHLVVEGGIHGLCRTPVLQFEQQHCSTESNDWPLSNICASLFLLDTEIFVLILFGYPKLQCIFVFPLMYCFQLIHRMILCFSSIQRCLALNQHFRFQIVVSDLYTRILYSMLLWYKYEFTRLAH